MSKPPDFYQRAKAEHPDLFRSYESLGDAARQAGPLDERSVALVKLGMSIAVGLEGASHSATRKALAAGCTPPEIRHVALLGVTTLGFAAMMRGRVWVEDVLGK